jgi:hypothetical protein
VKTSLLMVRFIGKNFPGSMADLMGNLMMKIFTHQQGFVEEIFYPSTVIEMMKMMKETIGARDPGVSSTVCPTRVMAKEKIESPS